MKTFPNRFKAVLLVVLFGFGAVGLAGCDEGRFEDAGEEMDEAGEEMEQQFDEAEEELE